LIMLESAKLLWRWWRFGIFTSSLADAVINKEDGILARSTSELFSGNVEIMSHGTGVPIVPYCG